MPTDANIHELIHLSSLLDPEMDQQQRAEHVARLWGYFFPDPADVFEEVDPLDVFEEVDPLG